MRGPLTYLYCCSYEGENVHDPNPIDVAAQASGEPTFREVGVGPWSQTHPGEPRPDDASSPNYDIRFDSTLRHDFEVAVENWTHDFNIGSMVRTANAFQARRVHIVGPHKWNRKGALMTELYQHVENHPSITELVECWKLRIAGEIAAAQSQAAAIAFHMRGSAAATDGTSGTAPNTGETMAQLEALDAKIAELQAARVIALDIIPGAVPMETYHFPKRCLMLFGAEGPGLSEKALELADDVVYISQFGSVRSINAGAAAAVSMHAWIAQHAAPQA